MADEMLGAVDDVIIPVALRPTLHRPKVRTRAGLRHGQTICLFSSNTGKQVTLSLLTDTGLKNVTRPADKILQGKVRPAQFSLHQRKRHTVETAATEFLRHVGCVKPLRNRALADLLSQLRAYFI